MKASDGSVFSVTNHLVNTDLSSLGMRSSSGSLDTSGKPHKWMVVWAGDMNAADNTSLTDITNPLHVVKTDGSMTPGPDFLAVVDAEPSSPTYGKIVNTATIAPLVENEPHHMQYIWHAGNTIYAGGLYSAATYMFDVSKLPALTMSGVSIPADTPCGSVPDAFAVLPDGTAYGTYMGGPVLPGPCRYTDGQVRVGNGFGGTPGEVVHFAPNGKVLSESPATPPTAEDPSRCANIPALPNATCANVHGIQVRQDLHRMVTSDFAEPRDIILDPVKAPDPNLYRPTVRFWDTSNENDPKMIASTVLPNGPRGKTPGTDPLAQENRAGMEPALTNLPQNKGAFAETFCGGALFYTPDITAANPAWREVFDDATAARKINPKADPNVGCDGGSWVAVSPDDHTLYHAVIGRNASGTDPGMTKMVYSLDISKLIASGANPQCNITTVPESYNGGSQADCPTVASVLPVNDPTTGGPHFGSFDNWVKGPDGRYQETTNYPHMAFTNYFVARYGMDGDHMVCQTNVNDGKLSLDTTFRDENTGQPCVSFNRTNWPHGAYGPAKPHLALYVINNG
ncbi:selenium-binding family protein [Amycolatopsis alkalitolerans]|nr:selenium-binding family protein [Amycolatopsis alkalitolerans]